MGKLDLIESAYLEQWSMLPADNLEHEAYQAELRQKFQRLIQERSRNIIDYQDIITYGDEITSRLAAHRIDMIARERYREATSFDEVHQVYKDLIKTTDGGNYLEYCCSGTLVVLGMLSLASTPKQCITAFLAIDYTKAGKKAAEQAIEKTLSAKPISEESLKELQAAYSEARHYTVKRMSKPIINKLHACKTTNTK